MAEDKVFTQDEVNQLVGKARLEGKEIGRKEFEGWISPDEMNKRSEELSARASDLSAQIETLRTEKETLQTQLTEKDSTIAKYEMDSVKTQIAREFGLSYEAIGFLQGNDEEAIRQSAESLKNLVGSNKVPPLANPESQPEEDGVTAAFRKLNPNIKF